MSRRILLSVVLICMLALSAAGLIFLRSEQSREQAAFTSLAAQISSPGEMPHEPFNISEPQEVPVPHELSAPALTVFENEERFAALIAANSDFAAWLRIDGTAIDYPVMYSPEDPDFYLHHDFAKQESLSGTIYIGNGSSLDSDNMILYGHNMKNGTMFSDLLRYTDADFCREHRTIEFDTVEESAEYEVLAVFREKVHRQDEVDVFRYYNYSGMLTEPEYDAYLQKIKELSLYDFGCSAVYGEKLVTLSTCAYHTENGRFVVVAVRHTNSDLFK